MGDYLVGPYLYSLYKQHGYSASEINLFYVIGFGSTMLIGTSATTMADRYGRRLLIQLYFFLYALGCTCALSPSPYILALGRVLGGLATSLLYTVFEAWMLTEHETRSFRKSDLPSTFTLSTFVNSGSAILSGFGSDWVVSISSQDYTAPFLMSSIVLVLGGILSGKIFTENFSSFKNNSGNIFQSFRAILEDPKLRLLGLTIGCFEASLFLFIVSWSPVLTTCSSRVEFGLVFSAFMTACMLGSRLRIEWIGVNGVLVALVLACVAHSTIAYSYSDDFNYNFMWFMAFELAVGIYFPAIGMMKARLVPESVRSSAYALFSVPGNVVVVVVALLQINPVANFVVSSCLLMIGSVASIVLILKENC